MRLLFLTGQVPYPPHAGGALRTYGLIDGLHAAGYTIDLLTFTEPDQPNPAETPLAGLCDQIVTVPAPKRGMLTRLRELLTTPYADMARRFYSSEFQAKLRTQLALVQYDLVQIESLEMAAYLPAIRAVRPAVCAIYDSFNAEYDLQRLMYQIDRRNPSRLPGAIYSFVQWQCPTPTPKHSAGSHRVCRSKSSPTGFTSRTTPAPRLSSTWDRRRCCSPGR
jgi:hypothetical protein